MRRRAPASSPDHADVRDQEMLHARADGKVAAITGGASGIGRALADAFGAAGMKLALADIEADPLGHRRRGAPARRDRRARAGRATCRIADAGRGVRGRHLRRASAPPTSCATTRASAAAAVWHGRSRRRLGVDVRRQPLGRRPRHPRVRTPAGRAGRGPRGEHRVARRASRARRSWLRTRRPSTPSSGSRESLAHELADRPASTSASRVLCPGFIRTRIAESDRNWPDRLGANPQPGRRLAGRRLPARARRRRDRPGRLRGHGASTRSRSNRFFVLSDPAHAEAVATRHREATDGLEPSTRRRSDASRRYGRPAPGTSTVAHLDRAAHRAGLGRIARVGGADEQRRAVGAAEHAGVGAVAGRPSRRR